MKHGRFTPMDLKQLASQKISWPIRLGLLIRRQSYEVRVQPIARAHRSWSSVARSWGHTALEIFLLCLVALLGASAVSLLFVGLQLTR